MYIWTALGSLDSFELSAKVTWVDKGFAGWNNAKQRIEKHGQSSLHIQSVQALFNINKVNVVQHLSSATHKSMMNYRTGLKKIFGTIKVLSRQGLALRGADNDGDSNFRQILQERAEDVSELKSWLSRKGYKWLHHNAQSEILEMMAMKVLSENVEKIRQAEFLSILMDETSDPSRMEQVSICIRIVSAELVSTEYFLGFHSTKDTKAGTVFEIVIDVFRRFDISIDRLRGQCFDGAANMSGKHSRLQSRLREVEPRALYVHCNAHNLNIVVQDTLEEIVAARKFIGMVKELIVIVKDSPQRLAKFKDLQEDSDMNSPALAAYCPTR